MVLRILGKLTRVLLWNGTVAFLDNTKKHVDFSLHFSADISISGHSSLITAIT